MTPQIKSHPIISKLIDAFGNWRKHRQEIREIRDLYDDEFSTLELRIPLNFALRPQTSIHSFAKARMPSMNCRNC